MASPEPLAPPPADASAGDPSGGSRRQPAARAQAASFDIGTAASYGGVSSAGRPMSRGVSFGLCEVAGLNDIATRVEQGTGDSDGCSGKRLCGLALRSLGAVGVVYGDIGTSPLYTLSSIYGGTDEPEREDLLGSACCLVYTLTVVVVVKYITCIMRADHEGEGGIFALLLNVPKPAARPFVIMAVIGASMLMGDGIITPAMSVLSALEGLTSGPLAGKGLEAFVVPGTILCLLLLFGIQPYGVGKLGRAFGPVMVVYFLAVAGIGVNNILRDQRWEVFEALNPVWVIRYFFTGRYSGMAAFWNLGSVVLSVTGAEALFADLGHFGRKPIVISWFGLVYPSLVLGYLGQAAFLLDRPHLVRTAFWSSVPGPVYTPMMVLVCLATIIASQSMITGCYSLVDQAVVLGLFPRVKTVHTDENNRGQIFIPEVAAVLCLCTMIMVLVFQASANLSGAYGIAVTSTFMMTSLLFFAVLRHAWHWSLVSALAVVVPLGCVDLAFLVANLPKVAGGGWVPLAMGLLLSVFMLTWQWGERQVRLAAAGGDGAVSAEDGCCSLPWREKPLMAMDVAGVFILEEPLPEGATDSQACCPALECLAQSTGALPRLCLLLAVDFQRDVPHVPEADRLQLVPWPCKPLKPGEGNPTFYARVLVGFAEPLADIRIERLLGPALRSLQAELQRLGFAASAAQEAAARVSTSVPTEQTSLGGEALLPVRYFVNQYQYRMGSDAGLQRKLLIRLFCALNLCCRSVVSFLDLPLQRVVLLGGVLEL